MRTTIDRAGRIVIPKAIRDEVGFGAGAEVDIRESGGVVQIEPTPAVARIAETVNGPVLRTDAIDEPLTIRQVRDLIESDRR